MDVKDKIIVVTGAASGIGRALVVRFKAEGAKQIVAVDLNLDIKTFHFGVGCYISKNGVGTYLICHLVGPFINTLEANTLEGKLIATLTTTPSKL